MFYGLQVIALLVTVTVTTRCHGANAVTCEEKCETTYDAFCIEACGVVHWSIYEEIAECRSNCRREQLLCLVDCKHPTQIWPIGGQWI